MLSSYATSEQIEEKEERIVVAVRVKPELDVCDNFRQPQNPTVNVIDENQIVLEKPVVFGKRGVCKKRIISNRSGNTKKTFSYDRVYSHDSKQATIYEELGKDVIQSCLSGYNSCIFAYGQTGSGKTYTMFGLGEDDQRGLIPRLCEDIFKYISLRRQKNVDCYVFGSMVEIYNEKIRDLLSEDPSENTSLVLREDPAGGWYVENLTEMDIRSANDFMDVISYGCEARMTARTRMNDTSSRSHTIFKIKFIQRERHVNKNNQELFTSDTSSQVNLVDLAGSEQMSTSFRNSESYTHTSKNVRDSHLAREKELISINVSLSALGHVITKLARKYSGDRNITHIPYRDSKLTKLLSDSLGGNSKTVMIATLSMDPRNYEQTVSTCRYADRVKSIKNRPVVNVDKKDKIIKQLRSKILLLKKRQLSEEDYLLLEELKRLNNSMSSDLEVLRRKSMREREIHYHRNENLRVDNIRLNARVDELEKQLAERDENVRKMQMEKECLLNECSSLKGDVEEMKKKLRVNIKYEDISQRQDVFNDEFMDLNSNLMELTKTLQGLWSADNVEMGEDGNNSESETEVISPE